MEKLAVALPISSKEPLNNVAPWAGPAKIKAAKIELTTRAGMWVLRIQ